MVTFRMHLDPVSLDRLHDQNDINQRKKTLVHALMEVGK